MIKEKISSGYDKNHTTVTSWTEFEKNYNKAQIMCKKDTYNQEIINQTNTKLIEAADKLILRGDVTELIKLVAKCQEIEQKLYTETSWNNFNEQLMNAKLIILDNSDSSQSDVDNALSLLQQAKDNLVKLANDKDKIALKIAIDIAKEVTQDRKSVV